MWQSSFLSDLAQELPAARIEPYGSLVDTATVDGWSDVDVHITTRRPFAIERAFRGDVWAFTSTVDGDTQVIRSVLTDGRRIDATIRGTTATLPEPSVDNGVRFDLTLAAVTFGRGSDLIGMHLCLGVIRQWLVETMEARDRATGTTHHRIGTEHDRQAGQALDGALGPLGPRTALAVFSTYGAWRAAENSSYAADPRGLEAVIRRGEEDGAACRPDVSECDRREI